MTGRRLAAGWWVAFGIGGLLFAIALLAATRMLMPYATYLVASSSMEPTLRQGQMVATSTPRAFCSVGKPKRGDVILLRRPTGGPSLRRIIGLPGDVVFTRSGLAGVNGRLMATGRRIQGSAKSPALGETQQPLIEEASDGHVWRVALAGVEEIPDAAPRRLGPGEAFVLGDNRGDSLDSRTEGPARIADMCAVLTLVVGGPAL